MHFVDFIVYTVYHRHGDETIKRVNLRPGTLLTDWKCLVSFSDEVPLGVFVALARIVCTDNIFVQDYSDLAELVRHLNDPEHPLTLEQLNGVNVRIQVRVDLSLVPAQVV